MKLHELEPSMDPRKPLRFAGLATHHRTGSEPATPSLRVVTQPLEPLDAGQSPDLASIDRVIAAFTLRPAIKYGSAAGWQHTVNELHARPRLAELRSRSAHLLSGFTGASTGVLVALWEQESEQLSAQLHAELHFRWDVLRNERRRLDVFGEQSDNGDVTRLDPLRAALSAVRATMQLLDQFDYLSRAFISHTVLALSPGAGAAVTTSRALPPARLERAFMARGSWGNGVVWLPERSALVGWATAGDGTHVFEISTADLVSWVDSLGSATPDILAWRQSLIPVQARLTGQYSWSELATTLTRLMQLGQTATTAVVSTGPGTHRSAVRPGASRWQPEVRVPVTRYLITAGESHHGIPPVDLTTGLPPAGSEWVEARFRTTWSVEQNRYLRRWVEAYDPTASRPPVESILVTILP